SMDLVARIDPGATEGTCNLVGKSEVTMSGKAAAFGGRMMGSVADQILKQFAGNFAARVQERGVQVAAIAGTAANDNSAAASDSAMAAKADTTAPTGSANTALQSDAAATGMSHPASAALTSPASPAPASELNVLALFWAIVREWFRGLFRRKPA
ncbi:MAG TPA: hypothetical protein VGC34_02320, partial [Steroidobacteraceae bacterium]